MQTRMSTLNDWEERDMGELEPCVATVEDGFEWGEALGGARISVQSDDFRSGRVTAVCAGITVDLREATLGPEGATIHVQTALSSIEILVPPAWEVVCDVGAIWSGVGERRRQRLGSGQRPQLRIAGMVVAGGLSVR
jgi:predicted membrane protein